MKTSWNSPLKCECNSMDHEFCEIRLSNTFPVSCSGNLNKEASAAYHNPVPRRSSWDIKLSKLCREKRMTKNDAIRRGEKILVKLQPTMCMRFQHSCHFFWKWVACLISACVDTKPRGTKATCIVCVTGDDSAKARAFPVWATKTLALARKRGVRVYELNQRQFLCMKTPWCKESTFQWLKSHYFSMDFWL